MKTDVHQHLWSEPLVEALSRRNEFPFITRENGLTVLYLAGERPYVIDLADEAGERRAELVADDGLDRALICLSSPLGIEWLPREDAEPLLGAYIDGARALGNPFAVWGSIALRDADPDDVDQLLERGCVGLSLPAGALGSVDALAQLRPVLARLEERDAPLLVHPGPGAGQHARAACPQVQLCEPLWWPAMTAYVASMQEAWLAFHVSGRTSHPQLRVIFTMLAGLAPLHAERLSSRGGPAQALPDPLVFYDTSSYGAATVAIAKDLLGATQVLYGSDRPVVDPAALDMPRGLDWDAVGEATDRALGAPVGALPR